MGRMLIMDNHERWYRLGIYEKAMPNGLDWKEKFSISKSAGFDYIEMSIDESDFRLSRLDWSVEQRKDLHQLMLDESFPIQSICLSAHRKYPFGSHDEKIRIRSLEIMKKAILLASDLGIPLIQLAGYDVYYEQGDEKTRSYFVENLKKALCWAGQYGICLGFETMETAFMDTVEKASQYVRLINSPYLGIYPDIGNLKNASLLYGKDANCDLLLGKGKIFAAHLKETKPGVYREVPFGTGHTDYLNNIKVLKEMGVCRFTGECWYTGQQDWQSILKQANQFLRTYLDQVVSIN